MLTDTTLRMLGCISTAEELQKALEDAQRPVAQFELAHLEEQAHMSAKDRFREHEIAVHTKLKMKL